MTTSREPGWHPDPEHPATLQRYWDGSQWTDDSRPTGYVTQPAGPLPGAATGAGTPVFGAAPPETGGPQAARRRLRAGELTVAAIAVLALVALVLVVTGVL